MACDGQGSWANFAAGLGVEQPVNDSTLDDLVSFYRERSRPPRIQVTPYQHSTLRQGLAARAFVSYEIETMLVRTLDDLSSTPAPPGLTFQPVDPLNDDDVAAFRTSQMLGFCGNPDSPAGMIPITERVARSPRVSLWLLSLDGRIVGSGGLECFENAGVLIAACVYPESRRRGVQSAFIRFRLQQAAAAGLEYVTVASTPGGATERNALRAGFSVAYTQVGLEQR
jgi:hypothetical protein